MADSISNQIKKIIDDELKKLLPEIKSKRRAEQAGRLAVDEMKRLISGGISPIRGAGRFAEYRGSYRSRIEKGQLGSKRLRPVNLKLTGQMLKSLTQRAVKVKDGYDIEIGYFNEEASLKESGHRNGANNQAKRPTIPAAGEELAISIQDKILNEYTK